MSGMVTYAPNAHSIQIPSKEQSHVSVKPAGPWMGSAFLVLQTPSPFVAKKCVVVFLAISELMENTYLSHVSTSEPEQDSLS